MRHPGALPFASQYSGIASSKVGTGRPLVGFAAKSGRPSFS
jgi:hypothetical protein